MKPEQRPTVLTIDVATLLARLECGEPPLAFTLVDVRRDHEFRAGHIPNATHLVLDELGKLAPEQLPEKTAEIVLYCASGARSLRAARLLADLGYTNLTTLDTGFLEWKAREYPVATPIGAAAARLNAQQVERYSRHLRLPNFGEAEQLRLLGSRVLLLGLGGLGTPAALYLAAAGVGTLGLLDDDRVELSNLQRQIIHATSRIGIPKTESAAQVLTDLNRDVKTIPIKARLTKDNVDAIFAEGWDVVVDGSDNYPTRYLVNDASFFHRIAVAHGSVHRFEGRVMTFLPEQGPCYRCVFSEPPPARLSQSCEAGGVLGVLPGLIGVLQATEALKVILGLGEPLVGRLLTVDALSMQFQMLNIRKNPACGLCGETPTIKGYVDYEDFCTK